MGRKRSISEHILGILMGGNALGFGEIRTELEKRGRRVTDRALAENLAYLMNQKLIKKVIVEGRPKYRLTNDFFNLQIKASASRLLDSQPLFSHAFCESVSPPYVIYTNARDGVSIQLLPSKPEVIIAHRMLEELEKYPPEKKDKVKSLVFWAYWAGVQSTKRILETRRIIETAEKACLSEMEKFKKAYEETEDSAMQRYLRAEKALLEIINLAKELMAKDNLGDFYKFIKENYNHVNMLKNEVSSQLGEARGEELFTNFLDYHEMILDGLNAAGILDPWEDTNLVLHSEVWNAFFAYLFDEEASDLSGVKGDLDRSLSMIKVCGDALAVLNELPRESKTLVVYLWGFPEVEELMEKSVIVSFEEWLTALREGWLYPDEKERTRRIFQKAYGAVLRGREPPDEIVDPRSFPLWTPRSLYRYHPRGKQPSFWEEILSLLSSQTPVANTSQE